MIILTSHILKSYGFSQVDNDKNICYIKRNYKNKNYFVRNLHSDEFVITTISLGKEFEFVIFKGTITPKNIDVIFDSIGIHGKRKTGETTKMIDYLIQQLFTEGRCTVVDHYDDRYAFCRVLDRLKLEHPNVKIKSDSHSNTITLL